MKISNQNSIRAKYTADLLAYFSQSEDCGQVKSNTLNFPVVTDDGEEGWVEIVIKVTKDDDGDDGYIKRQVYTDSLREKEEKVKARKEKAEKDKARKEQLKAEKEKSKNSK